MKVTIKLFANFRSERFSVEDRTLPDNTPIESVVRSLEIDEKEIGMIMLNGRHAPLSTKLNDGDILALFPLLGGG